MSSVDVLADVDVLAIVGAIAVTPFASQGRSSNLRSNNGAPLGGRDCDLIKGSPRCYSIS